MCKNSTLQSKLDRYTELKRQIDELGYELDDIKDFVKNEMKRRGKEELVVGPYKVSYKKIVSSSFDTKTFKEAEPETYMMYLKESSSMRFVVK